MTEGTQPIEGSQAEDAVDWSSIVVEGKYLYLETVMSSTDYSVMPFPTPFSHIADRSRKAFQSSICKGKLSLKGRQFVGTGRITIDRSRIYEDAIKAYKKTPELANYFNVFVTFAGEKAVDFGGVSRDFFSGFWEGAYVKMFDGATLLAPACHADVDTDHFRVLGRILSHGYLCCGFLPTRVSFPVLAFTLLGLSVTISQETLVQSFSEFLTPVDRKTIALALDSPSQFSSDMKSKVINILSRFGCRDMPTPRNLGKLLASLAKHLFKSQPFAAISSMNEGIPDEHRPFWQAICVEKLYQVFSAMTASPEKVLSKTTEPDFNNANEERVFGYLQQYIGGMKVEESKRFLRFVTGSSVVTVDSIKVSFNALSGLARRPIAHTCSNLLDLPQTYNTFLEFVEEFSVLLASEDFCWSMNSL